MSSKRVYGEAVDPSSVVAHIFHTYEGKDPMLQYILHAFINEMGGGPTGSVVHLKNGQLAFVLNKSGPVVLLLTNEAGESLKHLADPIDLGEKKKEDSGFDIDRHKPPLPPIQAVDILPSDLFDFFKRISTIGRQPL